MADIEVATRPQSRRQLRPVAAVRNRTKMRIRLVDYVGNPGGGIRFALELAGALCARNDAEVEIVSHGDALQNYRDHVATRDIPMTIRDIPPRAIWRNRDPKRLWGIRGTARMAELAGAGKRMFWEVPASVTKDCDVVWLPWLHRHLVPGRFSRQVVASFHDTILIDFPVAAEPIQTVEKKLALRHLGSGMRVVVSSQNTANCLRRIYSAPLTNVNIVPVTGLHAKPASDAASLPAEWRWADRPFVICPANLTRHKNHELLFQGYAASSRNFALVLTGPGTALEALWGREAELAALAFRLGLARGRELITLGYLSDETYALLLQRAAGLVMPTLAEGGGSFPVAEALWNGIPVIASDIPVLREQAQYMGAELLWFNPKSSSDLAARLADLESDYRNHKARFAAQVARLSRRSWGDVANEYMAIFCEVARK